MLVCVCSSFPLAVSGSVGLCRANRGLFRGHLLAAPSAPSPSVQFKGYPGVCCPWRIFLEFQKSSGRLYPHGRASARSLGNPDVPRSDKSFFIVRASAKALRSRFEQPSAVFRSRLRASTGSTRAYWTPGVPQETLGRHQRPNKGPTTAPESQYTGRSSLCTYFLPS